MKWEGLLIQQENTGSTCKRSHIQSPAKTIAGGRANDPIQYQAGWYEKDPGI